MEPEMRSDMREFMRVCDCLIQYMTDEECEDIACIVYFVRQRTVLPYGELDDVSASLAFAKLSSINSPGA